MNDCQGILEVTRRQYQSMIDKQGRCIYENYYKEPMEYGDEADKKYLKMLKRYAEAKQTRLKRELAVLMKNRNSWTTVEVFTWLTSDDKLSNLGI